MVSEDRASAAILLRRQSAAIACPLLDGGPVPGGSPADGPVGLGQYAALTPDVGGVALHAEPVGDLDEAHGVADVHKGDCTESLDNMQRRTDNQYMTTNETAPKITVEHTASGALRLTTTSEDGLTFQAQQSPLTQRVSVPGQYLHITGPMEHKRPQKAMYDLRHQLACDWPDNRNIRRRQRFNEAAHRLIQEALQRVAVEADRVSTGCIDNVPHYWGRVECMNCGERRG